MPKNVTIRDIAAEAGVSIALVSFVMNDSVDENGKRRYRVSEESREKILAAAKKLNYQPNYAARTLRNGRTRFIGVVLADVSNYFYGEIARLLEEKIEAQGYVMLLGNSNENPEKFNTVVRTFLDRGAEGLIVVPCEGSQSTMSFLSNSHIPFVVLDRKDFAAKAPKVVLDNAQAMKTAVSALLTKQCRHIEMISYSMDVSTFRERERGYLEMVGEASLGNDCVRINRVSFTDLKKDIDALIPGFVERNVDGLVFATNSLCINTIKALNHYGINSDNRIKLVGFDNSEAYDLFTPPIPHIEQPLDEISSKCSELIFDLINKRIPQENGIFYMEGRLVTKEDYGF